jgi:uncharacterized protein (DUF1810 family)
MSRLDRFREAQRSSYAGFDRALEEVRAGAKRGHWIWYVFPQIDGLGMSERSRAFALDGEEEAAEFLRDAELRGRLLIIATAVVDALKSGRATSLRALMGSDVDASKVVSSLTLFRHVASKHHQNTDDSNDTSDAYRSIAEVAGEVLAIAASEGYPPCAYTLRRVGGTA